MVEDCKGSDTVARVQGQTAGPSSHLFLCHLLSTTTSFISPILPVISYFLPFLQQELSPEELIVWYAIMGQGSDGTSVAVSHVNMSAAVSMYQLGLVHYIVPIVPDDIVFGTCLGQC